MINLVALCPKCGAWMNYRQKSSEGTSIGHAYDCTKCLYTTDSPHSYVYTDTTTAPAPKEGYGDNGLQTYDDDKARALRRDRLLQQQAILAAQIAILEAENDIAEAERMIENIDSELESLLGIGCEGSD